MEGVVRVYIETLVKSSGRLVVEEEGGEDEGGMEGGREEGEGGREERKAMLWSMRLKEDVKAFVRVFGPLAGQEAATQQVRPCPPSLPPSLPSVCQRSLPASLPFPSLPSLPPSLRSRHCCTWYPCWTLPFPPSLPSRNPPSCLSLGSRPLNGWCGLCSVSGGREREGGRVWGRKGGRRRSGRGW